MFRTGGLLACYFILQNVSQIPERVQVWFFQGHLSTLILRFLRNSLTTLILWHGAPSVMKTLHLWICICRFSFSFNICMCLGPFIMFLGGKEVESYSTMAIVYPKSLCGRRMCFIIWAVYILVVITLLHKSCYMPLLCHELSILQR